ncbi:hypothetical protein Ga0074812_108113 [Parafrankia irregularis]|uniref:Uncharacterized protein n=1 Tax=Parafrankia irregularis TaxID=795642 RepID=A0A0S4QMU1_9ACTN|nr:MULTISPECIES: hypothetical protein [Parafrankia]MBE3200221.1 hypothetical protein [Parafrankia sp. CH37]CUU56585.1 hypothetical protein Ga0074812_108113 [Parafrankia irregularis]
MSLPSPTAPDNTPFHSFRVAAGSVVLDLPFRPPPGWNVRAATLWPDSRSAHGWGADHWAIGPGGRGFVPGLTDVGDVLQFAAESPTPQRELTANVWSAPGPPDTQQPQTVHSWFGYLHGITRTSLIVRGPYQTPEAAYHAAQRALQIDLARTDTTREPAHHAEPLHPAAPPAAVSLDYHGDSATVGDPYHGWITVHSRDLASALMLPRHELLQHLRRHVPHLNGREPQVTVAALAARHIPHQLPGLLDPPSATPVFVDIPEHPDPTPAGPEEPPVREGASPTAPFTATGPTAGVGDPLDASGPTPVSPRRPPGAPTPFPGSPPDPAAPAPSTPHVPGRPDESPDPGEAADGPGYADTADTVDLASYGWNPADIVPPGPGIDPF